MRNQNENEKGVKKKSCKIKWIKPKRKKVKWKSKELLRLFKMKSSPDGKSQELHQWLMQLEVLAL